VSPHGGAHRGAPLGFVSKFLTAARYHNQTPKSKGGGCLAKAASPFSFGDSGVSAASSPWIRLALGGASLPAPPLCKAGPLYGPESP
jgi:hypothetical protein